MAKEDIAKIAVITSFGLYEFVIMTFGLYNAAQTVQRLMDTILRGLPFCYCYINDIIIASENEEQHLYDVLTRLRRRQNVDIKCHFAKSEVEYLKYWIMPNGIRLTEHKVKAIGGFP